MTYDPSLLAAIDAATVGNPRLRQSMLMGSALESGGVNTGPFGGGAVGGFQIQLSAHPGVTVAQAQDPVFATRFMLGAYTAALAAVPAGLWNTDPERAAEQTAYGAERPAGDYYAVRGTAAVDAAWHQATAAFTGTPAGASSPAGASTPGAGSSAPTPSSSGSLFNKAMLARIGIGVTACLVLLIGLDQLSHAGASPTQVVSQGAANTAGRANTARVWGRTSTGAPGPPGSRGRLSSPPAPGAPRPGRARRAAGAGEKVAADGAEVA